MGSFRLDPRRRARDEIHRVTLEQIELAAAELAPALEWQHDRRINAVHNFRRAAKRIRAALDLTRQGGERAAVTLLRLGFRESARALSRTRDRDSLGATLTLVSRRIPRSRRAAALASWKSLLLPPPTPVGAGRGERLVEEIMGRVRAMRGTWRGAELERLSLAQVVAALKRSWSRARDRFHGAWKSSDPEWLHETRKRCQRLQHQLVLVEGWDPSFLRRIRTRLQEVGESLGQARDAAMLLARSHSVIAGRDVDLKPLRRELRRIQRESMRDARAAGAKALRRKAGEIERLLRKLGSQYDPRSAAERPAPRATPKQAHIVRPREIHEHPVRQAPDRNHAHAQ